MVKTSITTAFILLLLVPRFAVGQSVDELASTAISEVSRLYRIEGAVKIDDAPIFDRNATPAERTEARERAEAISRKTGLPVGSAKNARACELPERCGFIDTIAFFRFGEPAIRGTVSTLPVRIEVSRDQDDPGFSAILRVVFRKDGGSWSFDEIQVQAES